MGRGLAPELERPEHEELARAALGRLRELQHRVQADVRRQVRRGFRVDLRPQGDRRRQLAANVLDLGEQVEGGQVLRRLLEHVGDFDLGVVQLADLD